MSEGRSLDELLKLDTYQGMTDEEIARLVSFKESVAETQARVEAQSSATQAFADEMLSRYATQVEQARQAFEVACAAAPGFVTIDSSEA